MKTPSTWFMQGAIPETAVVAALDTKGGAGAHEIFLGRVRPDEHAQGAVTAIEYTCYPEMATAALEAMIAETQQQYQTTSITVLHSLGMVPAGQLCLLVAIAAKHRKAAREACASLVERIKKELPVWGKEHLTSAASEWKTNTFHD